MLFVKDAETLRLYVVNKTLADVFHTTKEWLLGKLDYDYFPKEQADSFVAIDRDVLATRQMRVFEEIARAGGRRTASYATRKMPLIDEHGGRLPARRHRGHHRAQAGRGEAARLPAELEEANKSWPRASRS